MVLRLPDSWSNWNLEMLVFEERGKPEYPEKNLSDMIASAKAIDVFIITLFNSCINFTNVHLCDYCTKIFVIVVNTCVCRRSVDNKALILSYPISEQGREPSTNSTHIWRMASTPGFEPRPHWWEAGALTTAPPVLIH